MLWDGSGSGRSSSSSSYANGNNVDIFRKKTRSDLVVLFLTGFGHVNGLVTIRFVSSLNECKLSYHVMFYKFVQFIIRL